MRTSVLLALVILAAFLRGLPHPENFVPIGALALFAGCKLEDKRLAYLAPLLALVVGDAFRGFHVLIPVVYASFAGVTWIGSRLGRSPGALRIGAGGLVGALVFYVLTNLGVWAILGTYPQTVEGLMQCYIAAIPYFLRTLSSTLVYSGLLFGFLAALEYRYPQLATSPS